MSSTSKVTPFNKSEIPKSERPKPEIPKSDSHKQWRQEHRLVSTNDVLVWYELTIPDSIYSIVPLYSALNYPRKSWARLLPYWMLLYLTVAIQMGTVLYVRKIVEDDPTQDCSNTSEFLQFIMFLVYILKIWDEMTETFIIWRYINNLPIVKKWQNGLCRFVVDEHGELEDYARKEKHFQDWANVPEDIQHEIEANGVTQRYVNLVSIFVLLPKLFMAGGLWFYGQAFLAYSTSDADLLLNSVALHFVLDVDDFVATLIPPADRLTALKLPTFKYDGNPQHNKDGGVKETFWAKLQNSSLRWYNKWGHVYTPIFVIVGMFLGRSIYCSNPEGDN